MDMRDLRWLTAKGAFMHDELTMALNEKQSFCMDKQKAAINKLKSDGRKSLLITAKATHSGRIINNRCYPGTHVRNGVSTWTTPYNKPVLKGHPSYGLFSSGDEPEVLGRIVNAEYIRILQDDSAFENDWKAPDHVGEGSGYILTHARVDDLEYIDKFLDQRFLTISAGHRSPNLRCSICGADWAATQEPCEHEPGRSYEVTVKTGDGKNDNKITVKCYMITGPLEYDHWAVVNTPADPHAVVTSMSYSNGLNHKDTRFEYVEVASAYFLDSNGSVSLCLTEADSNSKSIFVPASVWSPSFVPVQNQGGSDTDKSRSKEAKNMSDKEKELKAEETELKKDDEEKAPEKTEEPAEKVEEPEGGSEKSKESAAEKAEESEGKVEEPESKKESDEEPSEDRLAEISILASILDSKAEYDWTSEDMNPEVIKELDAKLTTAKRKALATSSFCGPDRSFPVNNCAHYTAAKRLLGRYKGPGDKSSIRACIERKGKKLGCTSSSKSDSTDVPVDTDTKKNDNDEVVIKLERQIENLKASLDAKSEEISQILDHNVAVEEKYRTLLANTVLDRKEALGIYKPEEDDGALEDLAARPLEFLELTLEDLSKVPVSENRGSIKDPAIKRDSFSGGKEKKKEDTVARYEPATDRARDFLNLGKKKH